MLHRSPWRVDMPGRKKAIGTTIIVPFIIVIFFNKSVLNVFLHNGYLSVGYLIIDILLIISLMRDFYYRWTESRIVKSIASTLHLTSSLFRIIAAMFLGGLAIHAVDFFYVFTDTMQIRDLTPLSS